jgi:hypothetical protein
MLQCFQQPIYVKSKFSPPGVLESTLVERFRSRWITTVTYHDWSDLLLACGNPSLQTNLITLTVSCSYCYFNAIQSWIAIAD